MKDSLLLQEYEKVKSLNKDLLTVLGIQFYFYFLKNSLILSLFKPYYHKNNLNQIDYHKLQKK